MTASRYRSRNPLAATAPLRSVPLYRHPAAVFGATWHDGTWNQPRPAPAAPVVMRPAMPATIEAELQAAAAVLREAEQCFATARRLLGEANRTRSADLVVAGRVVMPGRPYAPM